MTDEGRALIRKNVAKQPDGQISKSVSSPDPKNISLLRLVETALLIPPSHPTEGRIAIVTDAGRDAVDAAALGAQRDGRAGLTRACERSNGELTNDVAADGEVVWS
jgi:hypothetical protein